jgi:hypothetical protein
VRSGVGQISLGYLYKLGPVAGLLVPGLGATGSLSVLGPDLRTTYGTRTPVGDALRLAAAAPVRPHALISGWGRSC